MEIYLKIEYYVREHEIVLDSEKQYISHKV